MTSVTKDLTSSDIPWWIPLVQGIASIILGVLLVTNTAQTFYFIIMFVGIYWLIDGIFALISLFVDRTAWGWKLFRGIIGIWAGFVVIDHTFASMLVLPTIAIIMLAIQGIILGGISIYQAFNGAGWASGILGGLSILIGLVLLANPLIAAATLPWVLGVLMIVGGIAAVIVAFRLK
jgi:uncharacterized membrane protein HdeD (DUF308 family)